METEFKGVMGKNKRLITISKGTGEVSVTKIIKMTFMIYYMKKILNYGNYLYEKKYLSYLPGRKFY